MVTEITEKVFEIDGYQIDEDLLEGIPFVVYFDVTVNISCDHWNEEKRDRIMYNHEIIDDVNEIKSQIVELFRNDPKLEKSCAIACQVWITFYKSTTDKKNGSLMKMLFYSKDKTLYYPNDEDRKRWNRDQKIESVIN
jgi:hypothetical protein